MKTRVSAIMTSAYRHLADERPLSPSRATQLLINYCRAQYLDSGYCGAFLSVPVTPDGPLPVPVSVSLDQHCGLVQTGNLVFNTSRKHKMSHKPLSFQRNSRVLLHWPALIRNADTLVYSNPVLALFLLTFSKVLEQYSPLLLESLQRKYAHDLRSLPSSFDDNGMTMYPTNVNSAAEYPTAELEVLNRLLADASTVPSFIQELLNNCSAQYFGKPRSKERYSIGRVHTGDGCVPKDAIDACSIIHIDDTSRCSRESVCHSPAQLNKHCCGDLTPMLREFWVAYHLARPWDTSKGWQRRYFAASGIVKSFGVAVNPNDEELLIINWERWLSYRTAAGYRAPYTRFVPEKLTGYVRTSYLNSDGRGMATYLSEAFKSGYPGLHVDLLGGLTKKVLNHLVRAWSVSNPLDEISIVSIEMLRRFSMNMRKQVFKKEQLRTVYSRGHTLIPNKSLVHDFVITVGDAARFTCRAVHSGRKVYFQPSWDIPNSLSTINPDKVDEYDLWHPKNLKPGVTILPDRAGPAYTFKFLESTGSIPHKGTITETLRRYDAMNRREFKRLVSGRRSTRAFTEEEDAAIIKYYRPKRSSRAQSTLCRICADRTPTAISSRARVLRRLLLKRRIYSLAKLPHGQYNSNIGKEIAAARKLCGDD